MGVFYFLAIFYLANRLFRTLKFSPLRPKWRNIFVPVQWGSIGIYVALEAAHLSGGVFTLLAAGLLIGWVYFLNKEEDFKEFRPFIQSCYPLAAVGIISGLVLIIAPKFYDDNDNYFEIAVIAAVSWILGRWFTSRKQREELQLFAQKNNELDRLVAERTIALTRQKEELEKTVVLLQTTQQQLIQSEKLASLGELTAGIAHEIQNPLNFVNNFSDVSSELISEMEEELDKGDIEEAKAIAEDIRQNLEKISHHGKRADSIVKGMLQHSRASTGQKEPVNINALADEYLRLAYHGLRAKDKSFNSELVSNFDQNLPMVNIIPQDVGRVLLNLFTNAFYAVQQKQKQSGENFKPKVELTTLKQGNMVIIKVHDNGTGIPDAIKDKIMQPFFTTKPTGEGTGLGLSLSYDIIVKGHGGKIDINTVEGEFTEFVISLPV